MSVKYFMVNIRAYLDKAEPTCIGEESLHNLLSDFSCPYLVFAAEDAALVGYFSLTIKPLTIRAENISKTMAKKISRLSILDEVTQSYHVAAYLIAQLGKNYSLPKNKQIPGGVLLELALDTISSLKYSVGGIIEFLECEDNDFLLQFYLQNHFKPFDTRITTPLHDNSPHKLYQLLKFI